MAAAAWGWMDLLSVRCCGVHLRGRRAIGQQRTWGTPAGECRAHSATADRSSNPRWPRQINARPGPPRPGRRKIARTRLRFQRIAEIYDPDRPFFFPDYLSIAARAFLLKDSARLLLLACNVRYGASLNIAGRTQAGDMMRWRVYC